jgi:hypothetical protein
MRDPQWGDNGNVNNNPVNCYCGHYPMKFNGASIVSDDGVSSYLSSHTYHFTYAASGTTLTLNTIDSNYNDNTGSFAYSVTVKTLPASSTPTYTPTPSNSPTPTVTPTNSPTPTRTPTPTMTPAPTLPPTARLNFDLLIHGVGNGGDSVSPGSTGNFNLIHLQRLITAEVFDAQNQPAGTGQGLVVFNQQTGSFKGSVDMGPDLPSGVYTVKVKMDQSLKTLVPGIQVLTEASVNNMPQTTLINGDINNDNAINIIDYDILLGCYSDFLPAESCTPAQKVQADLTDDGSVNQFDYNLFLRELSNIGGQ